MEIRVEYIAKDGTEFDSKQDCLDHEGKLDILIDFKAKFKKIENITPDDLCGFILDNADYVEELDIDRG